MLGDAVACRVIDVCLAQRKGDKDTLGRWWDAEARTKSRMGDKDTLGKWDTFASAQRKWDSIACHSRPTYVCPKI